MNIKRIQATVRKLLRSLSDVRNRSRIQWSLIHSFSAIGVLNLILFGLVNLLQGHIVPGVIEIIGAMAGTANVIVFRRRRRMREAANGLLVIILFVLAMLLYTGGVSGTGAFWFFTFPLLAFFTSGTKEGFKWIVGMYFVIGIVAYGQAVGYQSTAYSLVELRQLAISLAAVSGIVYLYQNIIETSEALIASDLKKIESDKVELARIKRLTNRDKPPW